MTPGADPRLSLLLADQSSTSRPPYVFGTGELRPDLESRFYSDCSAGVLADLADAFPQCITDDRELVWAVEALPTYDEGQTSQPHALMQLLQALAQSGFSCYSWGDLRLLVWVCMHRTLRDWYPAIYYAIVLESRLSPEGQIPANIFPDQFYRAECAAAGDAGGALGVDRADDADASPVRYPLVRPEVLSALLDRSPVAPRAPPPCVGDLDTEPPVGSEGSEGCQLVAGQLAEVSLSGSAALAARGRSVADVWEAVCLHRDRVRRELWRLPAAPVTLQRLAELVQYSSRPCCSTAEGYLIGLVRVLQVSLCLRQVHPLDVPGANMIPEAHNTWVHDFRTLEQTLRRSPRHAEQQARYLHDILPQLPGMRVVFPQDAHTSLFDP